MVVVWALFALIVFVLEPIFLHRRFHEFALSNKKRAFAAALRFHAGILVVATIAIAAGVLGAAGALP